MYKKLKADRERAREGKHSAKYDDQEDVEERWQRIVKGRLNDDRLELKSNVSGKFVP